MRLIKTLEANLLITVPNITPDINVLCKNWYIRPPVTLIFNNFTVYFFTVL